MTRRSYEQACTMALALDVVGERWTLLILRELMLGPKRFTELLDGLPGIGRNLLAARLKQLEGDGLVQRRDRPAYELTEDGRALGPAMAALGQWGSERLGSPPSSFLFRPDWAVFPLSYMADTEAARGVHETYEFRIDDRHFHLVVDDGFVDPRRGSAESPDLVVTMDEDTLRALFVDRVPAQEALADGRIGIEGEPEVLGRAMAILAAGS